MVLASMTGFGRARGRLSDRFGATVVARSVNHKYLDVQVRTNLREEAPELEALVRSEVSDRFQRGRVVVQLNLERTDFSSTKVSVNDGAVRSAFEQFADIELPTGDEPKVELRDVLAIPGLVTVVAEETLLDNEEAEALRAVVAEAIEAALGMRLAEGENLVRQIQDELGSIVDFLDWFEPQMPEMRRLIFERLSERVAALMGPDHGVEPERVIQEAAMMADRADVAEEVVRLRAHLTTFREKLETSGAVGRTLDFLCQEIHRELNTLGSKCREPGVTDRLVEAKAAGERVREQVQNLE